MTSARALFLLQHSLYCDIANHVTNCFPTEVGISPEDIHFSANIVLQYLQVLWGYGIDSVLRYTQEENLS